MRLYKLTDAAGRTAGSTQWGAGVTHQVKVRVPNPRLCTNEVVHAYVDADLALLMNPAHASFASPRLWEAEGNVCVRASDKVGCYKLTTTRELAWPAWWVDATLRRRVQIRFAALAARAVLSIFEEARPDDLRPRHAIEAAERYLSTYTNAAAAYAAYAASYAASAASDAAAYAALDLGLASLARQAVAMEGQS